MKDINDFDVVCDQKPVDAGKTWDGKIYMEISRLLAKPNLMKLFPPMPSKEVNEDEPAQCANKE